MARAIDAPITSDGILFQRGCIEKFKQIKPKAASESKIAQMFGKQRAHENTFLSDKGMSPSPDRGMSPDTNKGMSPNIRDGDYLDEEDFKALLAGMEPDQDVTEAVSHSEEPGDQKCSRNVILNDKSPLKEHLREDSSFSPQLVKSEKENHSPQTNMGDEPATSAKENGPTRVKSSPVSTPVKPQTRKASTGVKDHDPKRQRTNDASKDASKNALHAGVKQKQSNLLGFFSKQ